MRCLPEDFFYPRKASIIILLITCWKFVCSFTLCVRRFGTRSVEGMFRVLIAESAWSFPPHDALSSWSAIREDERAPVSLLVCLLCFTSIAIGTPLTRGCAG